MRRNRIPTTEDVARIAGVSRTTVSYVLNQRDETRIPAETRERVLRAAESLGYRRNRLAAALSTGRTYTVALVSEIKDHRNVAAWQELYLKDLFLAVTMAAARAGLNATLLLETLDIEMRPEDVADGRVDGVIVFRLHTNDDWVRQVVELGLPCVEIGTCRGRFWVDVDNAGGARQAVEHLVSLGHRRIVHYTRPASNMFVLSPGQRVEGFQAAAREAGIDEADALVVTSLEALGALFDPEIPLSRRPTAIFTYNDALAVDVLDMLTERGLRVPTDVSLMGFNNDLRATIMRPMLTTIMNPEDDVARVAVALLRRQIEGQTPTEETIFLPTSLVVRQSTAPPPHG